MQNSLDKLFQKTISLLEKQKIPYLIIGGLAAGQKIFRTMGAEAFG
jgi:hypothetical protein